MFMTFDKRLYIYASLIIASSHRNFIAATLPPQVQSAVPLCAQPCLESFVNAQYSGICLEPITLDCLCTNIGNGGHALGEGILSCIESTSCAPFPQTNTNSIASICTLVPGGITVTRTSSATSMSASSTNPNTLAGTTNFPTTTTTPSTTNMAQVTASASPDGVSVSGKVNLTMAQIAGITIAAAALLILTVGVFACVFFVRKRNRRLEMEDHKILTQTTPKEPDMQDIYFPRPPLSAGRRSRGSGRFSMMLRQKSSEEELGIQVPATSLQQRNWPRYYPIMPDEGIGIATTTSYPQPVEPVRQSTYVPAPAPSPLPVPIPSPSLPQTTLSNRSSTTTLPSYQPHSSYNSGISQPPQQPAPAYKPSAGSSSRNSQRNSQRTSRTGNKPRQSNALSFMTDIEETEQISSSEAELGAISTSSSCESMRSSTVTSSSSTKKARRPTLTINIPGQPSSKPSKPSLPPPPAQKPPQKIPATLPGPPPLQKLPSPPPRQPLPNPPQQQFPNPPRQQQFPSPPQQQYPSPPQQQLPSPPPQQPLPSPPVLKVAVPVQQPPRRAPSTNSAPMLQQLAVRASIRSASRPKLVTTGELSKPAPPPAAPSPILREEQVKQIPNSPTDILAAASTYARTRKASDTSSRETASSAALPTTQVAANGTFLLSDSERNTSSRSNSSVKRPSRGPSRGSRRGSDASVTSFEDDCEESEDETPPKEENKRLSPVHEASPVSTFRYPKIPRGANQSVPRSPGTPKNNQTESPRPELTPTRLRPEVNTAAAIAASQGIANRLWKTETSPQGQPLPTPEWAAHRRSDSWQTWAQNTPDASSAGASLTPQRPFASGDAPKITPTKRGDELFLDLRFSSSTVGR